MSNFYDNEKAHILPSFGRRQGRKLKLTKQDLLSEMLPRYLLTAEEGLHPIKAMHEAEGSEGQEVFPNKIWLEIGFGGGEHLYQLAKNHPTVLMIGAEPYMHGVGSLLKYMANDDAPNIRIVPDDMRPVMKLLPDGSVERIYLLFPDPWRKARHYKRRILSHLFLDEAARLLPKGGVLQLATDHQDYSVWMLEHIFQRKDFAWAAQSYRDWHEPPAEWVPTRYESKAKKQGRLPVYLKLIRQ
jgi:tRNA (guanine-N7-)-methyltransferase